jgi:hypothetical protein
MRPTYNRPGAMARGETADLNIAERHPDPNIIAKANARTAAGRPHRETFRTSRLLEFCSIKELTAQTGHDPIDWPLCIAKELLDNGIDGCEEAGIAPEIMVKVSTATGEISISDNGPGLPTQTISAVLDYTVRASSREAYCSPTRGAQGNALKTICAMPFCLDGSVGRVRIDADGLSHRIGFSVDQLRQEPVIALEVASTPTPGGTTVTVFWPDSACSILVAAKSRFVQIASDFAWLDPHARITLFWDGEIKVEAQPSDPTWKRWIPSPPTSAHWYDLTRFERYIAAHVAHDRMPTVTRSARFETSSASSTASGAALVRSACSTRRRRTAWRCRVYSGRRASRTASESPSFCTPAKSTAARLNRICSG